ncbi:heavy metal rnd efflux outer membrane protein, czcc family [hydrocarbon metagenome]|uniref:Heavy metal rnd efflux outer membrane protein, czcc family n=1 Tax=hydrocarbon metagenome TaxID=938273 RepID=A0A0W8G1F9_9ZZZZ
MRQYRLLIVLLFIVATTYAQNRLTIDDAIKYAFENNIELQKQSAKLSKAKVEIDESARLPNPIFSYSREELKFGDLSYNEWIASGTLSLNFLWNRWSKINSKEKAKEVEQLLYERLKIKTAADVRSQYYAYFLYSKLLSEFDGFIKQLEEIAGISNYRLSEGDISDYEYRRILVEINKIKSIVTEVELKKNKYFNNLNLLIGLNDVKDIEVVPFNYSLQLEHELDQLTSIALENRKDLLAFKTMIESEKSSLSYNKIQIIPEMSLTAGYKEQADNFNGTVFQLNVAVPLFDRNQTGIEKSEIQIDLLSKELLFLKEKIKREVSETYTRFTSKKMIYDSTKDSKLESIFSTAAYSYQQGEISLVDFIDGMNAYVDGLILQTDLEIEVYSSLFRLEDAVGKEIIKIGQ